MKSYQHLTTANLALSAVTLFMLTWRWAVAQAPISENIASPELIGGPWLNTPDHRPIKLAARKGKVTVVEFWTFG